ncbi:MAG: glycosyltransferase family 2 protein, partial [Flexibacteraceae bacterium]
MSHFQPDVSVVIVSWNTKDLLRSCLKTVFEQTKEVSLEVFVVDNNSPDNSAAMVAEEFPQVKLIANPDNKGFAAANNQALEVCTGKYILLLNPDTEIVDGAIDKLAAYYKVHEAEKLGVLVCKLLNDDGSLQKSVNKFYNFWRSFLDNRFMYNVLSQFSASTRMLTSHWEHDESRAIDWAYGAVMFYSREVHDKVGVLDARFFIYAEEMDYFM